MAFSLSYLPSPWYHPVSQLSSSALHHSLILPLSRSLVLSVSLSPNSFSLSTLSPPPSLPMTLHKLRAIQVAVVMLIGLAMAYAYPPSRVWALIRAKQSPAHPSCSTRRGTDSLEHVMWSSAWTPAALPLFMCQIVPGLVLHRQED